jgi:hypothetical protein
MHMYNWWLIVAGTLSAVASLAHLCCIWGGAPWYRFFGAGERMARQAERGAIAPTIVTSSIATMLALWSAYAFSGAGLIPPLPLLNIGLIIITMIYLLRAAALPLMMRTMPDRGTRFLLTSSAIVLLIGLIHAGGLIDGTKEQSLHVGYVLPPC